MTEHALEKLPKAAKQEQTTPLFTGWSKADHATWRAVTGRSGAPKPGDNRIAGIAIEPCTPPGMNPMDDPANPNSPKYDAQAFGPKPSKEIPSIPKYGVFTPEELEVRKRLHELGATEFRTPQYLPYSGVCKPDEPEIDPKNPPLVG